MCERTYYFYKSFFRVFARFANRGHVGLLLATVQVAVQIRRQGHRNCP